MNGGINGVIMSNMKLMKRKTKKLFMEENLLI